MRCVSTLVLFRVISVFLLWVYVFAAATPAFAAAVAQPSLAPLALQKDPYVVLDDVLSRPEFKEAPGERWLEEILDYFSQLGRGLAEWLDGLIRRVGPINADFEFGARVMMYMLLAAMVAGGVLVLIRLWMSWVARDQPAAAGEELPDFLLPGDPEALRRLALEAAQAGDYSRALVIMFRTVLAGLDSAGTLKLSPSLTTREILRIVPATAPARGLLSAMIEPFNAIRYGGMVCGKAEFERFLALADQLAVN